MPSKFGNDNMESFDHVQYDVGHQHDNNFSGGNDLRGPDNFLGPNISDKRNGLKGGLFPNVELEREAYYLEKDTTLRAGEKPNWSRVSRRKLPLNDAKILEVAKKARKETRLTTLEAFNSLTNDQQTVINRLIEEKQAEERNPNATWSLSYTKKHIEKNYSTRVKETKKILVIIKREPLRKGVGFGSRRDPDVIDLADPAPRVKPKNKDIDFNLPGLGGGKNFTNFNDGGFRNGHDNFANDKFRNGHNNFANDSIRNGRDKSPNDGFKNGHDNFANDNFNNNGAPQKQGKNKKFNNSNIGEPMIHHDVFPIEDFNNNGGGKAGKGKGKNKKDQNFPNDPFLNNLNNEAQPQVVEHFPDPFAGITPNEQFRPMPLHDLPRQGAPHQQQFPQQHPVPFHQGPPPPPGAIHINDWQNPPIHHQPAPIAIPFRDPLPLPLNDNPFRPDFPPTIPPTIGLGVSPPRSRPHSRHRRNNTLDDPAFLRKVEDWTLNDRDHHSSDDSYRDDMWSNPSRGRETLTPPSSPGGRSFSPRSFRKKRSSRDLRYDFIEPVRERRDSFLEPVRRISRDYEVIEPKRILKDREYDLVERGGRRRHSPDVRPRGLRRALTDYPSGPVAEFRRPKYDDVVEYDYASKRGGSKYHRGERRQRGSDYDYEERERDRRGGSRRSSWLR